MGLSFKRHIAIILAVMMTVVFIPVTSFAAADEADDITYTVDTGDELSFDEDDFNNVCEDLTGETLDYVYFTLPSSSKGTLYYDNDEVSESSKYYYDDSHSRTIGDVTFVPEDDYSGTVTVYYDGVDTDDNEFSGVIRIKVEEGSTAEADAITYTVDTGDTLDFDEEDFNNASNEANDEDIDYVKFTLPSASKGTLYLSYYNGYSEGKISATTKYYYDGVDDSNEIGNVTFVPADDYTGTVTIDYKGYDTNGDSFAGTVKITVEDGSSGSGDIKYSIDSDEDLAFDGDDFNDYCQDENDEDLNYVRFTLPSSTKGILWYDYDGNDEAKVKSNISYYYDDDPSIDDITFVPNADFSGTVNIKFEGEDMAGDSIEGTVVITVKGDLLKADTVSYTVKPGSSVVFKEDDFNNVCKKLTDKTLNYVKFTLPSAASGKLYYGYTSSSNYSSTVNAATKYYYSKTPFLLSVTYVPAANANGVTTIDYTGYATDGSEFTGRIQITVSGTALPVLKKSKYFSDVDEAYSWAVDYIDTMYQAGIITGSVGTNGLKQFNPAAKIKRGEFMVLLYRALNLKSSGAVTGNFSDVAKGEYYYDAIAVAKTLGIAQGSDNKFYPNSSITREDTMVLALRAMNKSGSSIAAGNDSTLSPFIDQNVISSYARDPIAALIKAGIITGSDDHKIHPMESITRAEAAAIIYRIKY